MLKPTSSAVITRAEIPAAFGRLCVETVQVDYDGGHRAQPPSGGCVLKQNAALLRRHIQSPAAFGRLCVETHCTASFVKLYIPAAFGRLCVETHVAHRLAILQTQPPSGGCVLKLVIGVYSSLAIGPSRLRAAVC